MTVRPAFPEPPVKTIRFAVLELAIGCSILNERMRCAKGNSCKEKFARKETPIAHEARVLYIWCGENLHDITFQGPQISVE